LEAAPETIQPSGRRGSQTRLVEEEIIAKASAGFQPLPMLDVIFSRMAPATAASFRARASLITEVTFDRTTYACWGDIVTEMDPHAICATAEAPQWNGAIALSMDSVLVFSAMERLTGGTPTPETAPRRPPTGIARETMRHLFKLILEDLASNISRIAEATFSLEAVESPKEVGAIHGVSTPCAVARMEVRLDECIGSFSVIIPLRTLDPVQERLSTMFLGDKLGGDTSWRDHIASRITGSSVVVTARIHEKQIPLTEILGWKPGTQIDFSILPDQEVTVMCSGIPILYGHAGRLRNGNIALRVTREAGAPGAIAPEEFGGL
jgi:flagellar motor switch protein FliM